MSNLNEKQIIEFLRSKAAALNSAADALEGTTSRVAATTAPRTITREPKPQNFALVPGQATKEGIRERVSKKSARIGDLAREFQCSEETISAIINDPESELVVAERGWVKRAEDDGISII